MTSVITPIEHKIKVLNFLFNFGVYEHDLVSLWNFVQVNRVHIRYVEMKVVGKQYIFIYEGLMTEETKVAFKLTVPVLPAKIGSHECPV
jgi:hypothetical protein